MGKRRTYKCSLCGSDQVWTMYQTTGEALCGVCMKSPDGEAMRARWDASWKAARAEHKAESAKALAAYNAAVLEAMRTVGLAVGDRVCYFAASMLGIGGMTITGRIVVYRGRVMVRCDGKADTAAGARRYVTWNRGWTLADKPARAFA